MYFKFTEMHVDYWWILNYNFSKRITIKLVVSCTYYYIHFALEIIYDCLLFFSEERDACYCFPSNFSSGDRNALNDSWTIFLYPPVLINCTHMHDLEGDEGLGPLLRFESNVSPLS